MVVWTLKREDIAVGGLDFRMENLPSVECSEVRQALGFLGCAALMGLSVLGYSIKTLNPVDALNPEPYPDSRFAVVRTERTSNPF